MADITFYGTRGACSLTSAKYTEFGGATTCILLKFNKTYIMVDCGSGINNALDDLKDVEELHLFITHSHFDHITGAYTLLPAFKNKKLHIYGKAFNGNEVRESIDRIMQQSLWPVSANAYSDVDYINIDGPIQIGDIRITNMDSNHPGGCSLFRFESPDDCIVTAFDFCHLDGYEEKLIEFAQGCRTLIYDGNFSQTEILDKPKWGHSTPEEGCYIGQQLGVSQLYITHFGIYDDDQLSVWENELRHNYPFVSFARSGIHKNEMLKMIDIGTLLNVEKDNDKLITKILEAAMDITNADGGTLYILDNRQLEFKVLINKSKFTKQVRKEDSPISIPPVNIFDKNICAAAAREKQLINVDDCYSDDRYDFSGVQRYDALNDYKTKSVLAVPLIDDNGDLIGVLQLINALDKSGKIISFGKNEQAIVQSIANQAAMSIVNATYSTKINDLLYGFVRVMSVGIDERTPYNANHTKNMIKFADRFFDWEEANDGKYKIDDKKRREILMSIWLHDTGKILTPLYIMNKENRLGRLTDEVMNRFEKRDLLLRLSLANKEINQEEFEKLENERIQQKEFIQNLNTVGFLSDELLAQLNDLFAKSYKDIDGLLHPVITEEEYYQLTIKRGTLTKEERQVMEGHVSMTQKLLSQLNFPKYYDNIPVYAGNHHEFLNGSGYPNHLTSKDLPWPCRLITIFDIFEALIAHDRPYKKPMPVDKALQILHEMAGEGKLDEDVINEFEKAQPWLCVE